MTIAIVIAALVAVCALLLLARKKAAPAGAVTPKPTGTNGPIHDERCKFPREQAYAWKYNFAPAGEVFDVGTTGSMAPYFTGNEFVIVVPNFDEITPGKIVAYRLPWAPPERAPVIHRIAAGNAIDGWIPKGDAPGSELETWNPITRENYIGSLVAVFRPIN